MSRNTQKATAITLVLLAATLWLVAISTAQAQTTDQAGVVVLASVGGTTDPVPGNYTYNSGDVFNMTAIPDDGFQFSYWIISGEFTPGHTTQGTGYFTDPDTGQLIQLPTPKSPAAIDSLVVATSQLNITCGFGYTYNYQAVFAPTGVTPTTTPPPQTSPATNAKQGVVILPSIGGTTSPAPGTYSYDSTSPLTLMATANANFTFHYWIVSGSYTPGHLAQPQYIPGVTDQYPTVPSNQFVPNTQDSLVFATNPATITCGYGYTYTYQAVFDPVNSTTPTIPLTTPSATQTPVTTSTPVATVSPVVTATPATNSNGISTWVIVAVVVVIIIIIIALAAVMMMRRKK